MIYNYITTNLLTGKQYIGTHSTENVDDGYLGSGILILKSIKKYGKEYFKRDIICNCTTIEESFTNEEKYIKEFNTCSPLGYNLSPTGGLGVKGCHSEETKNKMRKPKPLGFGERLSKIKLGHSVSIETKTKQSNTHKNKIPWNKGKKGVQVQSQETIKKRNEAIRKTLEIKRKALGPKIEQQVIKLPRIPWNKGKTGVYSKETLKKMGEHSLGRKASEETRQKMRGNTNGHGNKGRKCLYLNVD